MWALLWFAFGLVLGLVLGYLSAPTPIVRFTYRVAPPTLK